MSSDPFGGLGPALRGFRIERGWTQVELADRAGVSKSMLSLYEGGRRQPHLNTLGRLLDTLGVQLGELALRLGEHPPASNRRGPRRDTSEGREAATLEAEAVAAVTTVLQEISALLRAAAPSPRPRPGPGP